MKREFGTFLGEFIRQPKWIGAVAPSSRHLATRVVGAIDWSGVRAVLEYGPGTGVVTEYIVANINSSTKFLAIELNPRFAAMLRQRFPHVSVCQDSVANVKSLCERERLEQADAIVSGLPWASFSDQDQTTYLDAIMSVLKPGGQFVTFGYLQGQWLPAGQRFKKKLHQYFSVVEQSRPVWANFPPAFVYRCRR